MKTNESELKDVRKVARGNRLGGELLHQIRDLRARSAEAAVLTGDSALYEALDKAAMIAERMVVKGQGT